MRARRDGSSGDGWQHRLRRWLACAVGGRGPQPLSTDYRGARLVFSRRRARLNRPGRRLRWGHWRRLDRLDWPGQLLSRCFVFARRNGRRTVWCRFGGARRGFRWRRRRCRWCWLGGVRNGAWADRRGRRRAGDRCCRRRPGDRWRWLAGGGRVDRAGRRLILDWARCWLDRSCGCLSRDAFRVRLDFLPVDGARSQSERGSGLARQVDFRPGPINDLRIALAGDTVRHCRAVARNLLNRHLAQPGPTGGLDGAAIHASTNETISGADAVIVYNGGLVEDDVDFPGRQPLCGDMAIGEVGGGDKSKMGGPDTKTEAGTDGVSVECPADAGGEVCTRRQWRPATISGRIPP